jgi:hypothetical protein
LATLAVVPLVRHEGTVPASSVAGVIGKTWAQRWRGVRCERAANHRRSAGS